MALDSTSSLLLNTNVPSLSPIASSSQPDNSTAASSSTTSPDVASNRHHHHENQHHHQHHLQNYYQNVDEPSYPEPPASTTMSARRKAFVLKLTRPSSRRGYIVCRLCEHYIWGPNGRYHVDKCPKINQARETAREEGLILHSIKGIIMDSVVFKKYRSAAPKQSKVRGFVMSHSVTASNPLLPVTDNDRQSGIISGRKGYIRCITCNSEVYAPNARHHMATCSTWRQ